jgi:hypothetical protein
MWFRCSRPHRYLMLANATARAWEHSLAQCGMQADLSDGGIEAKQERVEH